MHSALFDFSSLKLTKKPNQFLLTPADLCQNAEPHELSITYPVSPARVYSAWKDIVARAPRTEILAEDPDNHRMALAQRSALFRFQDRINFAAFAAGADQCTIAVYSRSLLGYSDLGANKARIRAWLEKLDQALAIG